MLVGMLLLAEPLLWAQDAGHPKPGPKDKCPVCGMFVAKYPDFVAVVSYKDNTHAFFDGVKDMMKYYFNLRKYSPSKKHEDILQIHVTDYYGLTLIDGSKAYYVLGSDVYGPMGREFIPFNSEADAEEFLRDHKGKTVLRFQDINLDLVMQLDSLS
jgi:nitrous oxide reductase accessory protein NosL